MNSYNEFAKIYDELMNDVDYDKWFSYIEEIFIKNNKKPLNILEMACGTGNLTKYLCENRYDVTCFDMSSEMLSVAYEKLRGFKNVKILNQDMTEFNVNKKFEAVISICDSINYITNDEDLKEVFTNVYNHLNDDGIFIFDINSHYKLSEIIGNNTFVHDEDDIFYTWQNYYDEDEKICEFYLTFFIKENDKYIRVEEEHCERAYKIEEIIEVLKSVGFKDINYYDEFTFDIPNQKSERINFVVKK